MRITNSFENSFENSLQIHIDTKIYVTYTNLMLQNFIFFMLNFLKFKLSLIELILEVNLERIENAFLLFFFEKCPFYSKFIKHFKNQISKCFHLN